VGKTAILTVKIVGDASGAARAMNDTASASDRMASGLKAATPVATAAFAAVATGAIYAAKAASSQEQALGALNAVFGENAAAMERNARAATQIGLSTADYAQQAALLGARLTNLGVAQEDLGKTTDGLINTAADLAAQFGGPTTDAVSALGSALAGETDPIERYGISMKEATIAAKLAELGLTGLTGEAEKAARTQAILAIVAEQSATSLGAFARESGTAAGAGARATSSITNMAAALGEGLLPPLANAMTHLEGFSLWATENRTIIEGVAIAVASLAAAVLLVNAAMAVAGAVTTVYSAAVTIAGAVTAVWTAATNAYTLSALAQRIATVASTVATVAYRVVVMAIRVALIAWAVAQWALNAAMYANPIGLVVLLVVALVAAFILAYKKSETFRNAVNALASTIRGAFVSAFAAARRAVDSVIAALQSAWNWIKKVANAIPGVSMSLAAMPGRAMPTVPTASAYTTTGARGATPRGSVVVQGLVVDPEGVARVLRDLDRSHRRRTWAPAGL
jgi:phage-related protein